MQTDENMHDTGAWRLPNTHLKMRRLAKALAITLKPLYSSTASVRAREAAPSVPAAAGLTRAQVLLLGADDASQALQVELDTGYPGTLQGQTSTYMTGTDTTSYWRPETGMQAWCAALADRVDVVFQARVYHVKYIKGQYVVKYVQRTGKDSFAKKKVVATQLVLACGSWSWPRTNFHLELQPVQMSTGTTSLLHIYLDGLNMPRLHKITRGKLGQVVSMSPTTLMVYVAGVVADYHFNLRTHHPGEWRQELFHLLHKEFPRLKINKKNEPRFYYWKNAVSFWHPNVSGKALTSRCVVPHPVKLPGLAIVGEEFSRFQGWAEGALETAEIALRYLLDGKHGHRIIAKRPAGTLCYDGRVLDVREWMKKHPGGQQAIKSHWADEDVLPLVRSVHLHAPHVFGMLLAMQTGFLN